MCRLVRKNLALWWAYKCIQRHFHFQGSFFNKKINVCVRMCTSSDLLNSVMYDTYIFFRQRNDWNNNNNNDDDDDYDDEKNKWQNMKNWFNFSLIYIWLLEKSGDMCIVWYVYVFECLYMCACLYVCVRADKTQICLLTDKKWTTEKKFSFFFSSLRSLFFSSVQ